VNIIYYQNPRGQFPIKEFINSLAFKQRVKIFRVLNYFEKYGIEAILPHVKKISGTFLWEIRILGKDNLRIIYFIYQENMVVLLNGFVKKTQKTSKKDLSRALSYFQDWKTRLDK